jgi:hypothetical protein
MPRGKNELARLRFHGGPYNARTNGRLCSLKLQEKGFPADFVRHAQA